MTKLFLILAFHHHQPVGNFDHILEEAYGKAYLPFLETLMEYPKIKVVLHYSGHLLSWIKERHPNTLNMIRKLVEEERAEILSGGFYEPIIPVIPQRDGVMQVKELNRFVKKSLGFKPKGIWIAERVWEPQMPQLISKTGLEYLTIDDFHFKLTGLEESDLFGYYTTEDQGNVLSVFPGSERLRYYIPYKPVDEIISYFREISMTGGTPLLTYADDGEKFGVWPNTHRYCYKEGWLDDFFTAIENSNDWLETTTFDDYRTRFQPMGRIYLPTGSYREMGQWTLPSEAGLEYEYILEELGRIIGDKSKQVIRGGFWRSFMVKYPESNHIHKRMFMTSKKVQKACRINSKRGREAQKQLWQGQCNDAYWHGIFGGLYLPHLRSALYGHLLKAEFLASGILKERTRIECFDFDSDGYSDIIASTGNITLAASEKGGCLTELSLNNKAVNILDILSRRPETYHAKLARSSALNIQRDNGGNDTMSVKEEGLSAYLIYDNYRRASLIDHFFPFGVRVEDIASSEYDELGDFIDGIYSLNYSKKGRNILMSLERKGTVQHNRVMIDKRVLAKQKEVCIEYILDGTFYGLFAVEMNISLLGSPYVNVSVGDKAVYIKDQATHHEIREFSLVDKFTGLRIDYTFSDAIGLWHYPVETISLSEAGLERVYQGTSFLFVSDMQLAGMKKIWFTINFKEVNNI
jgi:alpha-amylase